MIVVARRMKEVIVLSAFNCEGFVDENQMSVR
jgi:hypothetical protein